MQPCLRRSPLLLLAISCGSEQRIMAEIPSATDTASEADADTDADADADTDADADADACVGRQWGAG